MTEQECGHQAVAHWRSEQRLASAKEAGVLARLLMHEDGHVYSFIINIQEHKCILQGLEGIHTCSEFLHLCVAVQRACSYESTLLWVQAGLI